MPPHLFSQHAQPRPQQPLDTAEALGCWHEPPRIRPSLRRSRWPGIAALSVIVALLSASAWTLTAHRFQAPDASMVIGRAGQ